MRKPLPILVHLVMRDFRDFLIGWILLAIILIATTLLELNRSEAQSAQAYCFMLFLLLYSKQVWGEGPLAGNIISRSYLRTLPVRRRTLFILNFLRNFVGALPLFIFGTYHLYSTQIALGHHSLALFTQTFGFMLMSSFLFMVVFVAPSTEQEALIRTAGKLQRSTRITKMLARSLSDSLFFGLWISLVSKVLEISISVPRDIPVWGPWVSLAYFSFRLRSSYKKWLFE